MARSTRTVAVLAALTLLSGCNALTRMAEVGSEPALSKIENPTQQATYRPVSLPMPTPEISDPHPNSLWRPGARGFFKDQRASRIGDILTVRVNIEDEALLENRTEQIRERNTDSASVTLGGLEEQISRLIPGETDPSNLIDIQSARNIVGDGEIDRAETIEVTLAAMIMQVLPNGNLVIHGTQEVRVNAELRQLHVMGVVRREDISSRNEVNSNQIAELRVAYGGRGTLTDVQTPRWGSQIYDLVFPF